CSYLEIQLDHRYASKNPLPVPTSGTPSSRPEIRAVPFIWMKYGRFFSLPSGSPRSFSPTFFPARVSVAIASSMSMSTRSVSLPRASWKAACEGTFSCVAPIGTIRLSSYEIRLGRKTTRNPCASTRYTTTAGFQRDTGKVRHRRRMNPQCDRYFSARAILGGCRRAHCVITVRHDRDVRIPEDEIRISRREMDL